MIDIVSELKTEVRRLQHERDVLRLIAIDEIMLARGYTRDEAESKVNEEILMLTREVRS